MTFTGMCANASLSCVIKTCSVAKRSGIRFPLQNDAIYSGETCFQLNKPIHIMKSIADFWDFCQFAVASAESLVILFAKND